MKRVIALALSLLILLTIIPYPTLASSARGQEAAQALYELGLFSGTGTGEDGQPNFDLRRVPTRVECIAMLVKLLGKDADAQEGTWTTPFTDVPDWAVPYVGYAYANSLTSGISNTEFGSLENIDATQYISFVLKALGYESGKDFQWNKAWVLSDKIGLTHGEYTDQSMDFTRGDVAIISYQSLLNEKSQVTIPEQVNFLDTCFPYDFVKCNVIDKKIYLEGNEYRDGLVANSKGGKFISNLLGQYGSFSFSIGLLDDVADIDYELEIELDGKPVFDKKISGHGVENIKISTVGTHQLTVFLSSRKNISNGIGIVNAKLQPLAVPVINNSEIQADAINLLDRCPPYECEGCAIATKPFNMASNRYEEGIVSTDSDGQILFNLEKKYSKISMTVGHIDGEYISDHFIEIYLDGVYYNTWNVLGDSLPITIEISVEGVSHLRIRWGRDVLGGKIGFSNICAFPASGSQNAPESYPANGVDLLRSCPPYQCDGCEITDKKVYMAGVGYESGIISTYSHGTIMFNLSDNYSEISFIVGHVDGEHISDHFVDVYLDGEFYNTWLVVGYDLPITISVDVKGKSQLRIEWSRKVIGGCIEFANFNGIQDSQPVEDHENTSRNDLLEVCPPYQCEGCDIADKSFCMAGTRYDTGILSSDYNGLILFNLSGKYAEVTFAVGHVDGEYLSDHVVEVYLDGKYFDEWIVKGTDMPITITIPVEGKQQLKIEWGRDVIGGKIGFAEFYGKE